MRHRVIPIALVGLVATAAWGCTSITWGPFSAYTYRLPESPDEWAIFYPAASAELAQVKQRCYGKHGNPHSERCRDALAKWPADIRNGFLSAHPDFDAEARKFIADGTVVPAENAEATYDLIYDYMVRQARIEDEARKRQESDREAHRQAVEAQAAEDERRRAEFREKAGDRLYVVRGKLLRHGGTVACPNPGMLEAALRAIRVGDGNTYNDLLIFGVNRSICIELKPGEEVVTHITQGEMWRVGRGMYGFWVLATELEKAN